VKQVSHEHLLIISRSDGAAVLPRSSQALASATFLKRRLTGESSGPEPKLRHAVASYLSNRGDPVGDEKHSRKRDFCRRAIRRPRVTRKAPRITREQIDRSRRVPAPGRSAQR